MGHSEQIMSATARVVGEFMVAHSSHRNQTVTEETRKRGNFECVAT